MTVETLVDVEAGVLSIAERSDLSTHEATIARGLQTFYDVGSALSDIRERRLYRESFSTFEDYCKDRWGIKRPRAYELMQAAAVVGNLSEISDIRESHAAELVPLPPSAQSVAWAITNESDKPVTAARIREVVDAAKSVLDEQPDIQPEQLPQAIRERVAHVSHNSGNNEWYTPSPFIDAARTVMGGIDCDPASSQVANATVKADRYFTKEDDGLKQEVWGERVWMNPPYAQPLIGEFADELVRRFGAGEVREACVLVNNATETQWFRKMSRIASGMCLIDARVKFIDPDGKPSGAPLQGQVVLYLGEDPASFQEAFAEHGDVWLR